MMFSKSYFRSLSYDKKKKMEWISSMVVEAAGGDVGIWGGQRVNSHF